jgi:chaperone modulatory protein CbpM
VEADWIAELVEHGIIEPVGQARSDWQFAMVSVVRVAKAKRLERDLALNLPGLALALDLLDEIDDLRSKLKLNQQPK